MENFDSSSSVKDVPGVIIRRKRGTTDTDAEGRSQHPVEPSPGSDSTPAPDAPREEGQQPFARGAEGVESDAGSAWPVVGPPIASDRSSLHSLG